MAANTLTTEAIALTEKKMDMALEDIIKMSKKTAPKGKRPRPPNKRRGFLNGHASQDDSKVQRFIESRSSIRQGVLAQRRSNYQVNQFPLTTGVARKAAAVPIRSMVVNRNKPRVAAIPVQRNARDGFTRKDKVVPKRRPQTLDALFADMKERRMRVMSQQTTRGQGRQTAAQRHRPLYNRHQQQQQQQQQGWGGVAAPSGRRFGR